MIALSKDITDKIEEYAKVKRELRDFEAEVAKHKQKVDELAKLQEEDFEFERAKELNVLYTIVQQAEAALKKRRHDAAEMVRKSFLTEKLIKQAIENGLATDGELGVLEKTILENIESVVKSIEEYKVLFRFKRDKHIEGVSKSSEENISQLVPKPDTISGPALSNGSLENYLKGYLTELKENK